MIRATTIIACVAMVALMVAPLTSAFAPVHPLAQSMRKTNVADLNMGFGLGDEEPKVLTRDNEPDDYFQTNTDKMSDEEKLPIALAGLAFVSLPFIVGLIALYASK